MADSNKDIPLGRYTYYDEYGNAGIAGVDMSFLLGLPFEEMVLVSNALNRLAVFEDRMMSVDLNS